MASQERKEAAPESALPMPINTSDVMPPTALEAITRGEIDVQIATAKRYPRTLSRVRERILELATVSRETAESCFYAIPRDGKTITGPSVRLAEIVAASYGNLRFGSRPVSVDATHVTCQGVAHDLENNVANSSEVKRRITNKAGRRYSDDMIVVTANAACAIALRNAVFKVIPTASANDIFAQIKKVGMGDERTLIERRKAAVAFFAGKGVPQDKLLATLEKAKLEDVGIDDLVVLNGIRTAVDEGSTTMEEAFGLTEGGGALEAGRRKISPPAPADGRPCQECGEVKAVVDLVSHKGKDICRDCLNKAVEKAYCADDQCPLGGVPIPKTDAVVTPEGTFCKHCAPKHGQQPPATETPKRRGRPPKSEKSAPPQREPGEEEPDDGEMFGK